MIEHVEKLNEFIEKTQNGLVLVDFYASWCGPCRMLSPVLEKIDEENKSNAKIIKVDVDAALDIARKYSIQVIPTLVILENGKELRRSTGYLPENQLLKFINQ